MTTTIVRPTNGKHNFPTSPHRLFSQPKWIKIISNTTLRNIINPTDDEKKEEKKRQGVFLLPSSRSEQIDVINGLKKRY